MTDYSKKKFYIDVFVWFVFLQMLIGFILYDSILLRSLNMNSKICYLIRNYISITYFIFSFIYVDYKSKLIGTNFHNKVFVFLVIYLLISLFITSFGASTPHTLFSWLGEYIKEKIVYDVNTSIMLINIKILLGIKYF